MHRHQLRPWLRFLAAIAMVAHALIWAGHTHAGTAALCKASVAAQDHNDCSSNDLEDSCAICWNLATSGNGLPMAEAAAPAAPLIVIARLFSRMAVDLPRVTSAAYRSRAPPAFIAH